MTKNKTMKYTTPKLLVLACVTSLSSAQAAVVIAEYEFTSGAAAATSSDANVTAGDFTAGSGISTLSGISSSGNNAYARSNGTTGTTVGFSFASANDDYFSFLVTPDSGYEMDLTSLTFDYGYSSTSNSGGQLRAYVTTSDDSHATFESFFTNTATVTGSTVFDTAATVDLSGAEFQDITSPLELRIYLSDEYNLNDVIHRIDNVSLNGSVSAVAVPEPSSMALCGLGAGFLLMRRRR